MTPLLAAKYEEIKSTHQNFEIIFVSGDRSDDECINYYASMPWLLLKFSEKSLKTNLMEEFNVAGIPSLILLDGEGNLITTHGRQLIFSAPFDKLKEAEAERASSWCTIS